MVPYAPTSLQTEDYHQYRAEMVTYPKAYDPFAATTPTFYGGSSGSRWDGGQAHIYSVRSADPQYEPIPGSQYTTYLHSGGPVFYSQMQDPSCSIPQHLYPSTGMFQETKCQNLGVPYYGSDYTTAGTMPSTAHIMVDLDVPSEPQRRTASPNSTLSEGDALSSGFNSEDLVLSHATTERDGTSTNPNASTLNAFYEVSDPDSFFENDEDDAEASNNSAPQKTKTSVQKDLERRRKNNEASRKSRAQRRNRFLMDMREVDLLKVENRRLRKFITELEMIIKEANDTLIAQFKY